jgi:hypothetical protein
MNVINVLTSIKPQKKKKKKIKNHNNVYKT